MRHRARSPRSRAGTVWSGRPGVRGGWWRPEVDSVEHYGHTLRVVVHAGSDPIALIASQSPGAAARAARVTVEDAFVSMVRGKAQDGSP